jgi:hypothetical protein
MNTITVEHAFEDSGNCREYYWVKEIHLEGKEPTHPKGILICSQDEGIFVAGQKHPCIEWYRATNDGIWYEPEAPLLKKMNIITVEGEMLRPAFT